LRRPQYIKYGSTVSAIEDPPQQGDNHDHHE
jgi:hypothetical protein